MRVDRVEWAAVPTVLDDNVPSVVRGSRFATDMDNGAGCGGPHLVGRIALGIALHRADVDPFMKLDAANLVAASDRSANEPVLAALPGLGFFALEVAIHVHEKILRPSFEQGVIFRGKVHERLGPQDAEGKQEERLRPVEPLMAERFSASAWVLAPASSPP